MNSGRKTDSDLDPGPMAAFLSLSASAADLPTRSLGFVACSNRLLSHCAARDSETGRL